MLYLNKALSKNDFPSTRNHGEGTWRNSVGLFVKTTVWDMKFFFIHWGIISLHAYLFVGSVTSCLDFIQLFDSSLSHVTIRTLEIGTCRVTYNFAEEPRVSNSRVIGTWLFLRGPFSKFVDSPYYSESELCGGAVTVYFSKYLPWQAMHFLQRSTHFSKNAADRW